MMRDAETPDYIEHAARMEADHYREVAARLRLMADIEPLGQRAAASAVAGGAT
jgi:hypothetical protein